MRLAKLLHNIDKLDGSEKTILLVSVWTIIFFIIEPIIVRRCPALGGSWGIVTFIIIMMFINDTKTEEPGQ